MEFVDVTLICQGVVVVAGGRDGSSQRFEPLGVLTVKWRDINLKKFDLSILTTVNYNGQTKIN